MNSECKYKFTVFFTPKLQNYKTLTKLEFIEDTNVL